ncbi:hypothetical protein BJV82DRAFT_593259 [Fennellomyces sp. T-0311]|nr:hypothetical protein BJV82DRAFT_593259 [Fennellomyces sp. T-0311]
MDSTSHRNIPNLPKATRRSSKWNVFVHLAFNGTDEEQRYWGSLINVSRPVAGATDSEVQQAYRSLSEEQQDLLQQKTDQINSERERVPNNPEERRTLADAWRKMIESKVIMMSTMFEYDACLLVSPRRQDDWDAEAVVSSTESANYALSKMGGITAFSGFCKEYEEGVIEAGKQSRKESALKRKEHRTRHDIAEYFKKEFSGLLNKPPMAKFGWGGFKRTYIQDDLGEKKYIYRNERMGVDLVGFDYKTDVAMKPDDFKVHDPEAYKQLHGAVIESIDIPEPQQKKVKLIHSEGVDVTNLTTQQTDVQAEQE